MTTRFTPTAVRKYAETRALEPGEARVSVCAGDALLFKKIGHLVNGMAHIRWMGEWVPATKKGQQWVLQVETEPVAPPQEWEET